MPDRRYYCVTLHCIRHQISSALFNWLFSIPVVPDNESNHQLSVVFPVCDQIPRMLIVDSTTTLLILGIANLRRQQQKCMRKVHANLQILSFCRAASCHKVFPEPFSGDDGRSRQREAFRSSCRERSARHFSWAVDKV